MRVRRGDSGGLRIDQASSGYDAASGDRGYKSRPITFDGADRQLSAHNRHTLVAIGRDMDRNSLLSAMLDRFVDGVVGSHINFRPITGDDGWNHAAAELIRDKMAHADHRGFFDAVGLTRIMLRALSTDGEQLWAMTRDDKIQAVETHCLGTPRDVAAGETVVDGIVLDSGGRPTGYWLSDEAYGGSIANRSNAEYVSASDAILPAYRKRISQTHGVPLVAAALKLYDRVDGYIDNESLAAEIDACLTFFIRKKSEPVAASPFAVQAGRKVETAADGSAQVLRKVEPGMIARIAADEEVEQFGAKRPGTQFTPFVEMGLTMVGATVGVPLPLALLDFKRLNYSNTRSLLLQMWQTWQIWYRSTVVPCWHWAYQRWLLKEIARSATLRARGDAFAVKWLPRRWPWVDPLREIQALHDEIALGVGTLSDQLELVGYTLDDYLDERQRELAAFAARGVPTTSTMATGTVILPPADGGDAGVDGPPPGDDSPDETDDEVIEP